VSAAVRYRVRHETVYGYGGNVAHSHQLLHLIPREVPRQSCLAHTLTLNPQPARRSEGIDAFGNPVTRLEYDQPHDRLEVLAELAVDVRAPAPAAASDSAEWEAVSSSLAFTGKPMRPDLLEASRYRMESSYVSLKQAFTAYGADCFTPRRPLLEAAAALSAKIHREFKFAPGSTDIRTSAIEAFAARQGVCQDFSHIMIACLRSRGVAARYVSGYLRTLPPPGAGTALAGADASHAWVSVFCPRFGWVDLDPTNDTWVGTDHIVIGWGRDFGDVSPLRGVIVGGGRHQLTVRVSVQAE